MMHFASRYHTQFDRPIYFKPKGRLKLQIQFQTAFDFLFKMFQLFYRL